MNTVFECPHRREVKIVGRLRHAFGGPSRHRDTVGVGVMHFLVERETTIAQTIDHMHFPQRARTVKHWRVQFRHKIVERLTAIFSLCQLVIKNML